VPAAPDHAPTLAAPGRRRPPQRAAQKNSRRGFFGSPSGRTLSRRHLPHGTAPGYRACGYKTASGRPKWLSRDPLGEYAGIDVYGYVLNDPVNGSDPFGLWQITISGGDFFGGSITFGNNGGSGWFNGQWNLGAYVGLGEGLSFNFDPNNSGCHDVGADPSLRVAGQLGFGPNVEGQLDIRDVNNLANSDSEITLNPPVIPGLSIPVIQQKNGQISFLNKMPTWGFGESGFAGLGETKYGSAPSKCSCSSSQ
jgi:RHS repeat-associated protein